METKKAFIKAQDGSNIKGTKVLLWGNNAAWICPECKELVGNRTGDTEYQVECARCKAQYEIERMPNIHGNFHLGPAIGVLKKGNNSAKIIEKRSDPQDSLFKNLFEECLPETSFQLVSEGLAASCCNADRLMSDAQLLINAGKLASATFLLTTAQEEIAKSYILIDCCRLDLNRHQSVLRKLCRAFYDHIAKQAYIQMSAFIAINNMLEARKLWETITMRWHIAEPEDEEPDMPHDTYFNREFPLYVNYGDYERRWLVPTDKEPYFKMARSVANDVERTIDPWRKAASDGLLSPEVLTILNDVFKKHFIGDRATKNDLDLLYNEVADHISNRIGVSEKLFLYSSPLVQWPLYHFV